MRLLRPDTRRSARRTNQYGVTQNTTQKSDCIGIGCICQRRLTCRLSWPPLLSDALELRSCRLHQSIKHVEKGQADLYAFAVVLCNAIQRCARDAADLLLPGKRIRTDRRCSMTLRARFSRPNSERLCCVSSCVAVRVRVVLMKGVAKS